jgi:hypothetical protein
MRNKEKMIDENSGELLDISLNKDSDNDRRYIALQNML